MPPGMVEFSVDAKLFKQVFADMPQHYDITISMKPGSAALWVVGKNPQTDAHIKTFQVHTHAESSFCDDDFTCKVAYAIEQMDSRELGSLIQKYATWSDEVHITVEEALPLQYMPHTKFITMKVRCNGTAIDAQESFTYMANTKDEMMILQSIDSIMTDVIDPKTVTLKMSAKYSAFYLNSFLKQERTALSLLLAKDEGRAMPLVMKRFLHNDDSHITYIIGPKL